MEVKPKIKIKRAHCMCLGCQENGDIWTLDDENDLDSWCRTVSVVGNYQVWVSVVRAMREYGEVVFDDSGIKEAQNEE
jgi:hypothetical protein